MRSLRQFVAHKQNRIALAILVFYVVVAAAAPLLAPPENPGNPSPTRTVLVQGNDLNARFLPRPPGPGLPFGSLPLGRGMHSDIFYLLVWGTGSALRFGLTVALTTASIGVLIGAVSAYAGGWLNGLIMRITDAFLTFPAVAGAVLFVNLTLPPAPDVPPTAFQTLLSELALEPVMLTLIAFSWMPYARLINANVMQLKQAEFVLAARAVGAQRRRIILRHLIPNAISPAIVVAARDIGNMVCLDAAFAFIGIGGTTQWGLLLAQSRDWIIGIRGNPLTYWWVFLPATLMLVFFSVGWGLLGDGLNDWLNPRMPRA